MCCVRWVVLVVVSDKPIVWLSRLGAVLLKVNRGFYTQQYSTSLNLILYSFNISAGPVINLVKA